MAPVLFDLLNALKRLIDGPWLVEQAAGCGAVILTG
jgi:hypothetical protein